MAVNVPSVYFVGGRGNHADDAADNGGGRTLATWDGDLSDFIDTNGGPVDTAVNADVDDLVGAVRITSVGNFANTKIGHIIYCDFLATYADGRYIVMSVPDDDTATLNETWAGDTKCDYNVGGALDAINTALTAVPDPAPLAGNQYIFTRKDEAITGTITFAPTGTAASNYWLKIAGYDTSVNSDLTTDMDRGGSNYGGPSAPDTADAWVLFDGGGGVYDLFNVNNKDNIEWRNIYFHDIDPGKVMVEFITAASENWTFINCKNSQCQRFIAGANLISGCVLIDHYDSGALFQTFFNVGAAFFAIDCVTDKTVSAVDAFRFKDGAVMGCSCLNNSGILVNIRGKALVANNTLYNADDLAINAGNAAANIICYNNIGSVEAVDDHMMVSQNDAGSTTFVEYNYAYCPAGDFTVAPFYSASAAGDSQNSDIAGTTNTINTDPHFSDAANVDFVCQNWALMEGGKPGVQDKPVHIGAVAKPSAYDVIYGESI